MFRSSDFLRSTISYRRIAAGFRKGVLPELPPEVLIMIVGNFQWDGNGSSDFHKDWKALRSVCRLFKDTVDQGFLSSPGFQKARGRFSFGS